MIGADDTTFGLAIIFMCLGFFFLAVALTLLRLPS